jgi:hypothetical protein
MGKFSTRDIVITITAPSKELIIKDLHIDIEIIKTLSATPNIANITVFGLAKYSRDFLSSIYDNQDSQYNVKISIDNNNLYQGDLVNIQSMFNVGTWETSLFANEGYNAFRKKAKIETKKGETREDILETMFGTLADTGLNEFDIQSLKDNCGKKSILKRITYDGNIIENIKNLIRDCLPDADLFIDDGKLNILPKNKTLNKNTILTNFLAPPELNEQGCKAIMQTNSDVQIGATVELRAKSFNQSFGNLTTNRVNKDRFSGEGTYKIIEIAHTFDNFTEAVSKTEITGTFLR